MDNRLKEELDKIKADQALRKNTLLKVCRSAKQQKKGWSAFFPGGNGVSYSWKRVVAAFCTAAVILTAVGAGYGSYQAEAAVISVDMNPSVELTINRWGRVIGETAYGGEAQALLNSLSLRNLSYKEALILLLMKSGDSSYLEPGSSLLVTLGTDSSREEVWFQGIKDCVGQVMESHHQGVEVEYGCTSSETIQEAHRHGMSMGMYCTVKEILDEDEEAEIEDFAGKNMEEIEARHQTCGHEEQKPENGHHGCRRQK